MLAGLLTLPSNSFPLPEIIDDPSLIIQSTRLLIWNPLLA